jgi:hypothetical protein
MCKNATFLGSMPASSDTAKSGDAADEAELSKEVKNKNKQSSHECLQTIKTFKKGANV